MLENRDYISRKKGKKSILAVDYTDQNIIPKISIVIPVYKRPFTVRDILNSLHRQGGIV